jgi:hypothetical protein
MISATIDLASVYYSGVTSESMRSVRIRASEPAPIVFTKHNGVMNATNMQLSSDVYPDYLATIINPSYPYVGFRQDTDSTNIVIPVFYNSATTPTLNDMTPVAADPMGDAMFTNTNLDIVNTFVSTGSDRFYFGIVNNGGGFPVSSGFTFFSYLAVIINPATVNDPNPVVWGLMNTVDVAGVVSPGLYRITGQTIADMARIGDIEVQTAGNLLVMSCSKADLYADPLFSAWYSNAHPVFAGTFMTNKISLSEGVLIADQSFGYRLIDVWYPVPQNPATAPMVSNASLQTGTDGWLHFGVDYFSAEAYFPLTCDVVIDNQQHYPMTYTSFPDWSSTMHYAAAINPSEIAGWTTATLLFSADNISFADTTFTNTHNHDATDYGISAPLVKRMYPNPARDEVFIDISKDINETDMEIYNLKGQRLFNQRLDSINGMISLDLSALTCNISSGLYLVRIANGQKSQTAKLLICK